MLLLRLIFMTYFTFQLHFFFNLKGHAAIFWTAKLNSSGLNVPCKFIHCKQGPFKTFKWKWHSKFTLISVCLPINRLDIPVFMHFFRFYSPKNIIISSVKAWNYVIFFSVFIFVDQFFVISWQYLHFFDLRILFWSIIGIFPSIFSSVSIVSSFYFISLHFSIIIFWHFP